MNKIQIFQAILLTFVSNLSKEIFVVSLDQDGHFRHEEASEFQPNSIKASNERSLSSEMFSHKLNLTKRVEQRCENPNDDFLYSLLSEFYMYSIQYEQDFLMNNEDSE